MRALLIFVVFCSFQGRSQDSLSVIPEDSMVGHSIKKAVIFSAVLPGAGQVYNHLAMPKGQKKAFWKVPLIYAGLGASTYFLVNNQRQQKIYREEYTYRQNNNGATQNPDLEPFDDQGLLTFYDQYLRLRDFSILAVGAVYFLQIVDAGVEAHFVSFDISEDLSMAVRPTMMTPRTPGLSLSFNFR